MAKRLYLRSFGCQMNEYDSDRMVELLGLEQGYQRTDDPAQADLILFNTCSVREKAQEKVFADLGRMRELKQVRPEVLIGVGGCVASQEGAAITKRAPYVDLVFGPQTLHRLPAMIQARRDSGTAQVDIRFPEIEKFDSLPPAQAHGPCAQVSIMEGCSKFCSFCVVPYTRGEEVSRPLQDVLTDVAGLADQQVREITLLGQNVNAWRGAIPGQSAPGDFTDLLGFVAEIPGIQRIRYTTSHPKEFTQRLIDAHARIPALAQQVHLPVQSGSDRILAAMKRGYSVLEYKSILRRLRAACPGVAISSDFIVGFPGETEQDFQATLELATEMAFDGAYAFTYSSRPGTPAAALQDAVPQALKAERLQRLQQQLQQNERTLSQHMLGSLQQVLVEGPSRRDASELCGRSSNNRMINFPGAPACIGQLVTLRITEARHHTLRGERVAENATQ